jgi:uncharacterized tellurite resistance protein B-like protein
MAHEFVRADGSVLPVRGYRYKAPPAAARRFSSASAGISRLPAKVDLRPYMTPVEDQGQTNSCAANATAGAYEYLVKRHFGDDAYDVSRMFIYYNARALESDAVEDEGSALQDVIAGLREKGACSEETWPFDPDQVNEEPPEEAYDEASKFLVEEAQLVPVDLGAWKTALAAGHPIIFGIQLYGSFDRQKQPGLVPMPSRNESSRESHGAHAMLCVGYSDPDEVFIVRNSWGPDWGDEGYCYIPYRYMMDEKHNLGDSWIIKRIDMPPHDRESWSDDEESVLEDVETALASMDDEEYASMLEAMGDIHFETRLALLFLAAAGADGEVSDEELSQIKDHLAPVLEQIGGNQNVEGVLRHAKRLMGRDDVLEQSIDLLAEHLPTETLASIANELQEIVDADGTSDEEKEFVDLVIERWQLEGDEEGEEDEEEDEGEDEDEEDEDEDED